MDAGLQGERADTGEESREETNRRTNKGGLKYTILPSTTHYTTTEPRPGARKSLAQLDFPLAAFTSAARDVLQRDAHTAPTAGACAR